MILYVLLLNKVKQCSIKGAISFQAMRYSPRELSAPDCSKTGCCVYSSNIKVTVLCLHSQVSKKAKKYIISETLL